MKPILSGSEIEEITRMVTAIIARETSLADSTVRPAGVAAGAPLLSPAEFPLGIPVGVSARHVHLSRAHVEALFGVGYQLTRQKDLMGGQYAAQERVTIVGLKLRALENVRILGPVRDFSQVEIAATDAVRLGVVAPLRESGDIRGSAPIAIVGPKGAIHLSEGLIIAKRHIHMSPADAAIAGLSDGSVVAVRKKRAGAAAATVPAAERKLIFTDVRVRVAESFTLEMHIDTDEANAAGIASGDIMEILHKPTG